MGILFVIIFLISGFQGEFNSISLELNHWRQKEGGRTYLTTDKSEYYYFLQPGLVEF